MSLIRKITVETGWNGLSNSERNAVSREKWNEHMVEVFENFRQRKTSKIFIAENESHAFLGYLFVGESNNLMTDQTDCFIYDIYVEKEFRGKGIGKMLMEKAESYCRDKKYPGISLMVSTHNSPALKLYARMGFEPEQTFMRKNLT